MKGIIWYYSKKEKGIKQLEKIARKYRLLGIDVDTRVTSQNVSIYCENGDIWRIVPCRESQRAQACNIGYIEYGTPKDVIEQLIMPCIKSYPYTAYNYY